MPTPDELGLHTSVIAVIPIDHGQELHIRQRTMAEPRVPNFFDVAAYNPETGYYLATPFPATEKVLDGLIKGLQKARKVL